ncbi:hypothetical protein Patl1_13910 [Pistacia atlantica]|uniref:Uncharacterized protein n=1 Tax=Pistacia atlantica TaxID=434234 RepID=A0ACC1AXG2_9ROSI|nr:hypothetical protein Patl1_13910 [Pistacia atlantica]
MVVLVLVVLLKSWSSCDGCLAKERSAILQLRSWFMDPFAPETWVEGSSDCCIWEMVECNNNTARIIKLSLNIMTGLRGSNWYLNFSYLFAFDDLESLDLGSNSIVGFEGKQL